jgi:hypothetical protein
VCQWRVTRTDAAVCRGSSISNSDATIVSGAVCGGSSISNSDATIVSGVSNDQVIWPKLTKLSFQF